MNDVDELLAYLKGESGFDRLLPKLIDRYRSLGRIGGSIKLSGLKPNEKEAFTTFFRKDYTHQSSATISFKSFEEALLKTKFAGVTIIEILEAYAGSKVITKKAELESNHRIKEQFFYEQINKHPALSMWLHYVKEKGRGTRRLHALYDENRLQLEEIFRNVDNALSKLPKEGSQFERLPFFSQKVTKDPHAFDLDTEQGKAFLNILQFLLLQKGELSFINSLPSSEEANDILQSFHLLRDDLLNFVTCTGLIGYDQKGVHPVWESANDSKSMINFPLREIIKLEQCRPFSGQAVFIVENSGVASAILDRWPFPYPPPLICTHGQFKLAALLLIDMLVKNMVTIFYSGDFDPEGLQMAQRLKKRAPNSVVLWRYDLDSYYKSLSKKEIKEDRLSILSSIDLEELQVVKQDMLAKKQPGYQEELVHDLIHDMKKGLVIS
ncbi:TIGR02679 family protein [Metabacillus arenae]|uniref:TIGR02679 family protein n=1 Tax=Metabacillus arenae TaxID=2771434 RepID=A0A926NDI5_9BACI|nr:TIGR02679 family protein [Metabacillus arenae]MBD1379524.1 TIGR02679 family protein [Metabacillus arenae]